MRKHLLGLSIVCLLSLSFALPVFGQTLSASQEINTGTIPKSFLNEDYQLVREINPRGQVISTGLLRISNEGGGKIGVYMQTLAHQDVDETTFGVFLDRWIESEQRWASVSSNIFTYTKADYPDEDLSGKSISFNIVGQPVDCYYRLRGLHSVTAGDIHEMLASETDGLLITK